MSSLKKKISFAERVVITQQEFRVKCFIKVMVLSMPHKAQTAGDVELASFFELTDKKTNIGLK